MKEEIDYALNKWRMWRSARIQGLDRGSYCENADPKYAAAIQLSVKYRELAEALLEFERKYPEATQ